MLISQQGCLLKVSCSIIFFSPANRQFFLRPQTTWYFFSVQVNLEKPLNSFHTNYYSRLNLGGPWWNSLILIFPLFSNVEPINLLPPLLALIRKVKSLFSSFLLKCQYRLRNSRRLSFVVWLNTFVRRGTLNRVPKNWNCLLPMICSRKIKNSQFFEWAFSKDDHLFV